MPSNKSKNQVPGKWSISPLEVVMLQGSGKCPQKRSLVKNMASNCQQQRLLQLSVMEGWGGNSVKDVKATWVPWMSATLKNVKSCFSRATFIGQKTWGLQVMESQKYDFVHKSGFLENHILFRVSQRKKKIYFLTKDDNRKIQLFWPALWIGKKRRKRTLLLSASKPPYRTP